MVGCTLMLYLRGLVSVAAFVALAVSDVYAAEKVGEATLIKTTVTGAGGALATRSPVHRDERIKTSSVGLGEFIFRDGTKFAVGGNSSVVIDKFVFDGSNSVKDLTIKAAKGSFRWISGGSKSSAYNINTPAGTIGIRGTAFDVYVGGNGTTAVVLFSGAARFCGSNGCRELKRRCDVIVATPRGGVSNPRRMDRTILNELGSQRALPFISGKQSLSGKFRVPGGSGCLQVAQAKQPRQNQKTKSTAAPGAPGPANPPGTPGPTNGPGTPGPTNGPGAPGPATGPGTPSPPDPPDPPATPSKGRGNNGKGNGAGDGSPNDRSDNDR